MRLDSIAATAPHLIERLEHFRNFTMAHPRLVRRAMNSWTRSTERRPGRSCSC